MKDFKFVIALVILLIIYVAYELNKPQPEDWSPTFSHESSEPFGAEALNELMSPLFQEEIRDEYKTIYELNEEGVDGNTLIVANGIGLAKEDADLLFSAVERGKTVFLSALGFAGPIVDTFGLKAEFQEFLGVMPPEEIQQSLGGEATYKITFDINRTQRVVDYPILGATNSFESFESDSLEVLAKNEEGRPVLVRYRNNGQLLLSTMPLAFTNYFTLLPQTTAFTEWKIQLIPEDELLIRNQYYQLGRLESSTPLRVLLGNRALRWATYLLLVILVVFFLFQSKRQQRIIPIITPLSNLTLEFVQTLGRLYYRQSDHANLGKKRVLYWKEFVRSHYNLNTQILNDTFIEELEKKSDKDHDMLIMLVKYINAIEEGRPVTDADLIKFEEKLNEFYGIE
jgi:hypothetical protein